MKDREATRSIRELAERQHGVVARWQLLELGVGEGLTQVRTEAGLLVPLFRGVFGVGHRRIGRRGQWMAAVLGSGPGAVLSHGSAMELWGLRRSSGPVEVLRHSGGPRYRRSEIRLHQTRALPGSHITIKDRIPITTVERTLLDMAGRLRARQLERELVAADRSGRLRWPVLQAMVGSGRGRKGVGRLRRVVQSVDPRAVETLSPQEVDFLALCRDSDLPPPQVNVLVEGYLVDFFWPASGVVVETDSYTYHSDRRTFETDHERTVALSAAGYEVHRATHRMLNRNPDAFVALVRRSLARGRSRTASTSRFGG